MLKGSGIDLREPYLARRNRDALALWDLGVSNGLQVRGKDVSVAVVGELR